MLYRHAHLQPSPWLKSCREPCRHLWHHASRAPRAHVRKLPLVSAFLHSDLCVLNSIGLPCNLGSTALCHSWEMSPSMQPRWTWGLPHPFPLSQESRSWATYFPMPENRYLRYFVHFIIVYREEQLHYQLLHQGWKQKSLLSVWKKKVNGYIV